MGKIFPAPHGDCRQHIELFTWRLGLSTRGSPLVSVCIGRWLMENRYYCFHTSQTCLCLETFSSQMICLMKDVILLHCCIYSILGVFLLSQCAKSVVCLHERTETLHFFFFFNFGQKKKKKEYKAGHPNKKQCFFVHTDNAFWQKINDFMNFVRCR